MSNFIPEHEIITKVKTVALSTRNEIVSIYGEDLAGYCIEASENIVKRLRDELRLDAKTVEGWCRFDDECYGSDHPWDPHTWVEIPSLGLYVDVTADQFNYGMYTENEFSEIIVQKGLPHGMEYDEPSWDDYEVEDPEEDYDEELPPFDFARSEQEFLDMAQNLYKYMDIDILAFLEQEMKHNTQHYQSDFEIDKHMIERYVRSPRKEDKTLLWMSRPMGTHGQREYEAFIRDTAAYNTWCFYAQQTEASIVAYTVELIGVKDGTIRGNVYKLDYASHAAEVAAKAIPHLDCEKVFEDGYVDRVPFNRSSYGYFHGLVAQHGAIVDSLVFPKDQEQLAQVLREQKAARDRLKPASHEKNESMQSLSDKIKAAQSRSMEFNASSNLQKESKATER